MATTRRRPAGSHCINRPFLTVMVYPFDSFMNLLLNTRNSNLPLFPPGSFDICLVLARLCVPTVPGGP